LLLEGFDAGGVGVHFELFAGGDVEGGAGFDVFL
jgi:hypothetical protein